MNNKRPEIFNNLGLKVLALLFAALLWLLVTSLNDPITRTTFTNVPVKLLHTNVLSDEGEVYSVLDDTDTIPVVTVAASRSVIDNLDVDNIVATADLEDLTSLNTVEIKLTTNKYSSSIQSIDGSIDMVRLSVEKKMTTMFMLKTSTNGNPADGYVVAGVTPEQNQIRISGPASVVSRIASAAASVDVEGSTGNISTYADIRLLDQDGNAVSTEQLTMNITSVKVSVSIFPEKEVPIEFTAAGTPAQGYVLNGSNTCTPSSISIMGRTSALAAIDSIVIPSDAVNVAGLNSDFTESVDLSQYLPDGVSFTDSSFDGKVTVTVGISEGKMGTVKASISDISLTNIPDGYTAQIISVSDGSKVVTSQSSSSKFDFNVIGLNKDVSGITVQTLAPTVNVTSLLTDGKAAEGTYAGAVSLSLPDNVSLTNTVKVTLELKKSKE